MLIDLMTDAYEGVTLSLDRSVNLFTRFYLAFQLLRHGNLTIHFQVSIALLHLLLHLVHLYEFKMEQPCLNY